MPTLQLMGNAQASDPRAMPLKDYIAETMKILKEQPEAKQILVIGCFRCALRKRAATSTRRFRASMTRWRLRTKKERRPALGRLWLAGAF
jgi:hypothetical protein